MSGEHRPEPVTQPKALMRRWPVTRSKDGRVEVDLKDLWLALSGANSDCPLQPEFDAAIRLWEQVEPLLDEREMRQR